MQGAGGGDAGSFATEAWGDAEGRGEEGDEAAEHVGRGADVAGDSRGDFVEGDGETGRNVGAAVEDVEAKGNSEEENKEGKQGTPELGVSGVGERTAVGFRMG